MKKSLWFVGFLCFILVTGFANARDFKGVNFPDKITIGKAECNLNGVGIRKKMMVDVYYGGLYFQKPTQNTDEVINSEEPKAVLIHVVYKSIDPEKWQEGWKEGFANTAPNPQESLKKKIETFIGLFNESVAKGEEVLITYDPSKGTEVIIKGKSKGTIEGSDFMKALWGIWFGPKPASKELKEGMLGISK